MIEIEIKIKGPGGVINTPIEMLEEYLINSGAKVIIQNSHSDNKKTNIISNLEGFNVKLIAVHLPWGG